MQWVLGPALAQPGSMPSRCSCRRRGCLCLGHCEGNRCWNRTGNESSRCAACLRNVPFVSPGAPRPAYVAAADRGMCGDGAGVAAALDSLPNLEKSSLRLWGLASSPRIHRFWLQRPGGACFADLYFCSVASFAPLSQTVWYLGQLPAVTRRRLEAIDGVRVELLPNHVFPSSLALWLAACLPVPLVKDLVYMRAFSLSMGALL